MNAAVVESFATPPQYASFAEPVPTEREILVNVLAAGLHPIVRALANGTHYGSAGILPFVPGVDGVGRLPDGTRVYFGAPRSPFGTFAERTVTEPRLCVSLADSLDDATVAAMTNPGMSSWTALKARAGFGPGESVLILGATGIAGGLAVQIAKRLGASHIVAAGRNPEALETLKALGADAIVSLDQPHDAHVASFRQHLADHGINVILDYLWVYPPKPSSLPSRKRGSITHPLASVSCRSARVPVPPCPCPLPPYAAPASNSSAAASVALPSNRSCSPSSSSISKPPGSPSTSQVQRAPLRNIAQLWSNREHSSRLVFHP